MWVHKVKLSTSGQARQIGDLVVTCISNASPVTPSWLHYQHAVTQCSEVKVKSKTFNKKKAWSHHSKEVKPKTKNFKLNNIYMTCIYWYIFRIYINTSWFFFKKVCTCIFSKIMFFHCAFQLGLGTVHIWTGTGIGTWNSVLYSLCNNKNIYFSEKISPKL